MPNPAFFHPRIPDTCSVTEFLHNYKVHLAQLAKSGRPEVLTVNGAAAVVVQDAAAYQRLLDLAEREFFRQSIRDELDQGRRGEVVTDAELEAKLQARRRRRR